MVRLRLQGKCKICKLEQIDIELFNELHTLRFGDNFSLERLAEYLEGEYIHKKIASSLIPNTMNLSTHFRKHIPVELIATYKLQTKTTKVRTQSEEDNVKDTTKVAVTVLVDQKVNLYDRLDSLYDILKQRFDMFDTENDKKVTLLNYGGYALIVRELRQCLKELNEMKKSEQLMKVILDQALQSYTSNTLQSVLGEIEHLKAILKSYIKDQKVVVNLMNSLESNIGSYFIEGSKNAVNTVKSQFKIH